MRRLREGIACAAVLALGCGAEAKRPASPTGKQPISVASVGDAGPSTRLASGYVLALSSSRRTDAAWRFADEKGSLDDAGMVVGGARVSTKISPVLGLPDDPPLLGGMRIPAHQGGGFLFWSGDTLFSARDFSGPLVRQGRVPAAIEHVASHPKGLLIRFGNGSRALYEPRTFRRLSLALDGIVDVESLADGRAIAILYGGEVRITRDAGVSWHAPNPALRALASGIDRLEGSLWLSLENGDTYRMKPDGTFIPAQPPPRLVTTALTQRDTKTPTLEQTVANGLLLDPTTALVYEQGMLWSISLPSGSPLGSTAVPVSPRTSCELVRAPDQPLLVCQPQNNITFVYAGLRSGHPAVETILSSTQRMSIQAAFGVFAWNGGCGAEPVAGHVCIRTRDGQWLDRNVVEAIRESKRGDAGADAEAGAHTNDLEAERHASKSRIAAGTKGRKRVSPAVPDEEEDQQAFQVRRWIPTADGQVVAWMAEGRPWRVDTTSGVVTELAGEGFEQANNDVDQTTSRGAVDQLWQVDRRGRVRGFRPNEIVEIDSEQGKRPTVPLVGNTTWALPRGLALDENRRSWQTLDAGQTWEPVGEQLAGGSIRCSEVGCVAGSIVRIGWESHPIRPAREKRDQATDRTPSPARPRIVCERSGDARTMTQSVPDPESRRVAGLGAKPLPVTGTSDGDGPLDYLWSPSGSEMGGEGPRVATLWPTDATVTSDSDQPVSRARNRTVQWLAPFDPSAQIHTSRLAGPTFMAAMRAAGAPWDTNTSGGTAIPVLDAKEGRQAGLLLRLTNPSGMLLLGSRPERAQPLFPDQELPGGDARRPTSAIATDRQGLAILFAEDSTGQLVVSTGRGSRREWQFSHPERVPADPNPPALAIHANNEFGIVFTPSGSEPASAWDPAVVVRRQAPLLRLAPWSTLRPASAPECEETSDEYRLVLATSERWLDVLDASTHVDGSLGMYAALRWNEKRVCLVALEAQLEPVQYDNQSIATRLVARFDSNIASRIALNSGYELRQPLTCRVEPARP